MASNLRPSPPQLPPAPRQFLQIRACHGLPRQRQMMSSSPWCQRRPKNQSRQLKLLLNMGYKSMFNCRKSIHVPIRFAPVNLGLLAFVPLFKTKPSPCPVSNPCHPITHNQGTVIAQSQLVELEKW